MSGSPCLILPRVIPYLHPCSFRGNHLSACQSSFDRILFFISHFPFRLHRNESPPGVLLFPCFLFPSLRVLYLVEGVLFPSISLHFLFYWQAVKQNDKMAKWLKQPRKDGCFCIFNSRTIYSFLDFLPFILIFLFLFFGFQKNGISCIFTDHFIIIFCAFSFPLLIISFDLYL